MDFVPTSSLLRASTAKLDRLSIELTNQCQKACWFCYNESSSKKSTTWTVEEICRFVRDCASKGIRAVSFGGGEPLEFAGTFDILKDLDGILYRSLTTNGLGLGMAFDALVASRPDKVHVSIHFPGNSHEVERVIQQVHQLAEAGIASGINLLVQASKLNLATECAKRIRDAGIANQRIVYLPMRGKDTPTPSQLAQVAGDKSFQSMTCLFECGRSPRFACIGWDKQVAWCSYTGSRRTMTELSFTGLTTVLQNLGLQFCGA